MLLTESLLSIFGKNPQNWKEYNKETKDINVVLSLVSKMLTESVRGGVLLALNDAFKK